MIKHCSWCDDSFKTESKNQIYCGKECRSSATKEKIIKRYKITKAKNRIGKDRYCSGGCKSLLSIYNNNSFCDVCLTNNKKIENFIKDLKGFFDYEQN